MATLEQLVAAGDLRKHEASLEPNELPRRYVFFAPRAFDWAQTILLRLKRDRGRDLEPYEQVEQALYDFVIGRPLVYTDDCRKLDPLMADVWELRTEDVRLVGWIPRKGCFVVVCGRMKKDLLKFRYYHPLIKETCAFRDVLDLDDPKALTGATPYAVF